ncbi:MAG TPA: carboxypeptidase regulatory-like domain-containing protein [Terriglobales bacterium]|nr:carboxypeptidase regulatory-like domain-containing protein [Terriglobales bacterium]
MIELFVRRSSACLLVAFFLTLPLSAHAQDASTCAIRGAISDQSGARISAAEIALVNTATGVRERATSNSEGGFVFDLLPPGDYSLRVTAPGMTPQLHTGLHLEVGGALRLDVRLSIAGANESVTVSEAPAMVETQSSAVSSVIDERAISDLPLNGRRFTDLALLTPGVTQDPRGLTSASNGDLAFGGVRGFQSSFLVDGADNNNAFFAQARGRYRAPYQFSNEVVQEFRVSSNSYGAELGRAGGAVVNVVTKSGTNHIHGGAFYFLRDSGFNARPHFLDFKPSDRQHQFGFTLGGPVRRNRAFFYAGFDQHIFHLPTVVQFVSGASTVTPQAGGYPIVPPDYEPNDQSLVFAAAKGLNALAGEKRASLIGNTGFFKFDLALDSRNYLSARFNTSRYYGDNNVFFDPASPITSDAISNNGEEDVKTETATVSLTTALTSHVTSHLRLQFSRDLQQSSANSNDVLTRIYGIIDGAGRSTILPRSTNERRLHVADTLSVAHRRHSFKFGGDLLLTKIDNFFPSTFGGEYIFDNIRVNPFTFEPNVFGTKLTPLRAFAHAVPRYYIQNFGQAVSHPDTNEYAGFVQDAIRVTSRFALNLGVRYDLQTFTHAGLITNPLWPDSGKVPFNPSNIGPRAGFALSLGSRRAFVVRGGYGLFYTRIPQIYTSSVAINNGVTNTNVFLDNNKFFDRLLFPSYPAPLGDCAPSATFCAPPASIASRLTSDVSAFSADFVTPRVHQASLSVEREVANRLAIGASYLFVHGENLIRARDVNLPKPTLVSYPVFDPSGSTFLGTYTVDTFSGWQMSRSLTCHFPPCINPLLRPIARLGAINVFESAATSDYHGATLSIRRRMTSGLYFRLAYTFAHAIDNGQDALVTGTPVNVQNSASPNSERGPSVTDQRQRFVFSWIAQPQPFHREHLVLGQIFNAWKMSSVVTLGSGRPFEARIHGDANQDDNTANDRLPGVGRNAFLGPDYATTDVRLSREFPLGDRVRLVALIEGFNVLNRVNARVVTTDNGFLNSAGEFVQFSSTRGIKHFPAQYRRTTNFLHPVSAYAPRQLQGALRLVF